MITFHRVLITTAILFAAAFSAWAFAAYASGRRTVLLVLAIAFAAIAVGLGYYLANLRKFLRL